MSWFNNLKVGTKLITSFVFVALIAGFIGYQGITSLKSADNSDTILFEYNTLPIETLSQISESFQRQRVKILESIIVSEKSKRENALDTVAKLNGEIASNMKSLEKTNLSEEAKNLYNKLSIDLNDFRSSIAKIRELINNDKAREAMSAYSADMDKTRKLVHDDLDNFARLKVKLAKERSDNNTLEADSKIRLVLILSLAGVIIAILLGYFISKLIGKPIQIISDAAQKVATGDVELELKQTSNDEIGKLMGVIGNVMIQSIKDQVEVAEKIANGDYNVEVKIKSEKDVLGKSLFKVVETIKELVNETNSLSKAAVEGKLATRSKVDKFKGGYREIVQGVNDTLDAVIGPLNVAAEYVDRIAKGDIPNKITDSYNGDFNEIKNNLNTCIDAINGLVDGMNNMSNQHDLGDIDAVIDTNKFQGAYKNMAAGVNNMVQGHITVKKKAMACIAEFGKGNFEAPLDKFPGKKAFINDTIEKVRENLKSLISDTNILVNAAVQGKLATRADASRHQGDFKKIVQGVNNTLDAVIGPLNVAAEYVDRIAKGDIPNKITDSYNGDFNEIKNNLNTCIDAINGLVDGMNNMSSQHDLGDIDAVIDINKFQGTYKNMAAGVNNMVQGHITVKKKAMACIAEFGNGNFEAPLDKFPGKKAFINDTIEKVRENLKSLISDTNILVNAAVQGKLAIRADASKHQGDFRENCSGSK